MKDLVGQINKKLDFVMILANGIKIDFADIVDSDHKDIGSKEMSFGGSDMDLGGEVAVQGILLPS